MDVTRNVHREILSNNVPLSSQSTRYFLAYAPYYHVIMKYCAETDDIFPLHWLKRLVITNEIIIMVGRGSLRVLIILLLRKVYIRLTNEKIIPYDLDEGFTSVMKRISATHKPYEHFHMIIWAITNIKNISSNRMIWYNFAKRNIMLRQLIHIANLEIESRDEMNISMEFAQWQRDTFGIKDFRFNMDHPDFVAMMHWTYITSDLSRNIRVMHNSAADIYLKSHSIISDEIK
jgi:hypothetical protein